MIYVESPLLISLPTCTQDLWNAIANAVALSEIPLELPQVWHYAALLSLKTLSSLTLERAKRKWVPPDNMRCLEECSQVLDHLRAKYTSECEISKFLLSVKLAEYCQLVLVWRYNSFGHHSDTNALCMYDITSFMSHSCAATGVWHFGSNDSYCLRARVALRAGDEISISYLGDDDLIRSTGCRREKTKGWLFECECSRCNESLDLSRGFRCGTCSVGSVFVDAKHNFPTPCDTCASELDSESLQKCLELERLYAERVLVIDKSDSDDVRQVYGESLNLFSVHHWIPHFLETCISDHLKLSTTSESSTLVVVERIYFLARRLEFLSRTFPMLNYTSTWVLEELADCHARQGLIREAVRGYERSYWMMRVLCGPDHPFTEAIQSKWDILEKEV